MNSGGNTSKRKRPTEPCVVWRDDLVPLLLANGFDLGFSGTTAYGTDKHGVLWQVAVIQKPAQRREDTLWYKYTNSLDHASESYGWMTTAEFTDLFVLSPPTGETNNEP